MTFNSILGIIFIFLKAALLAFLWFSVARCEKAGRMINTTSRHLLICLCFLFSFFLSFSEICLYIKINVRLASFHCGENKKGCLCITSLEMQAHSRHSHCLTEHYSFLFKAKFSKSQYPQGIFGRGSINTHKHLCPMNTEQSITVFQTWQL